MIQFARAGARPAHFDFYLQIIALRGPNPQDHAKGEDITLLVRFTESGCANETIKAMFEQATNEQIKAMVDLVTNKSTNKELQQYYDTHKE